MSDEVEELGSVGPLKLKIEGNGLYVKGRQIPLYSGSIDYWRIDRKQWDNVLERIRGLGFRVVSTAIPWNIHEVASELFDFGTTDEQRDIEGFLTLCEEKGLHTIVRPGPSVNAELAFFGYPKRILYDPEIQALSATGTRVIIPAAPSPFPMPSYASEKFYSEVTKYFDALCPILSRHLTPGGPIIGVQIDNELPLLFMNGPFSADYSTHAMRWYHEFLAGKYPTIGGLNRAYRTRYARFTEIEPPRALATTEREALPRYLDWMEFQEYYIGLTLSVIASLLWSRGIRGTFNFHNIRGINPALPLNASKTEREIDIQAVGTYQTRTNYEDIRRGALYMSTVSRLPFIAEGSMGSWPWGPLLSTADQQYALLVALMHGFRGFNIHMLVERDRWIGSPISHEGQFRDEQYTFVKRLVEVLDSVQFNTLQRSVPVLLLRNFEYERLYSLCSQGNWLTNLMSIPNDLLFSNRTFSYTETIQKAYPTFWNSVYFGLTRSKIPFHIGDTDLDRPALSRYQVIFLPTFDFMSEELQQKILDYVDKGGTAVIGPELPYLNTEMRNCTILADSALLKPPNTRRPLIGLSEPLQIEKEKVKVGSRLAGMVNDYGTGKFIFLAISLPPTTNRDDAIEGESVVIQSLKGLKLKPEGDVQNIWVDEIYWGVRAPNVIFVANPTNQPHSVRIQIAQRAQLRNAWTGEQLLQRGPQEIALSPYEISILEVLR